MLFIQQVSLYFNFIQAVDLNASFKYKQVQLLLLMLFTLIWWDSLKTCAVLELQKVTEMLLVL